jgi:hypothetical protein
MINFFCVNDIDSRARVAVPPRLQFRSGHTTNDLSVHHNKGCAEADQQRLRRQQRMSRGNQREADRAKNQAKLAAKQKAAVKVGSFVKTLVRSLFVRE